MAAAGAGVAEDGELTFVDARGARLAGLIDTDDALDDLFVGRVAGQAAFTRDLGWRRGAGCGIVHGR